MRAIRLAAIASNLDAFVVKLDEAPVIVAHP